MITMLMCLFLLLLTLCHTVNGDYQCLCNYNVEQAVYASKDTIQGQTLGYMYEFDCLPQYLPKDNVTNIQTVQFMKQVGYIEYGNGILLQTCQGNLPATDLVEKTTHLPAETPTTTSILTSTPTSTFTTTPSTTTTTPIKSSASTTPILKTTPTLTTIPTSTTTSTTTTSTLTTTPTTTSTTQSTATSTTTTSTTVSTSPSTTTSASTPTSTTTHNPTTATHTATCHGGWSRNGDSCYLIHSDNKWTWTEANAYCLVHNAHLAIITSGSENTFLVHFIKQTFGIGKGSHQHHSDIKVWIGATDHDQENTWVWKDPVTNTDIPMNHGHAHWSPHEPDSGDGEHDEDCAAIIGKSSFTWQDYRCTTHMFFVCERSVYYTAPAPALIG